MFGIGVIAATAWIHLLPDAFMAFTNPCLPDGWKSYGPAYVGLFGMMAAFLVQFIELAAVDFKRNYYTKDEHHDTSDLERHGSDSGDEDTLQSPTQAQPEAIPPPLEFVDDSCDCTDLERVVVTGNSAAFLSTPTAACCDSEEAVDDCECTDLDRVVVTGNSAAFLSNARVSVVSASGRMSQACRQSSPGRRRQSSLSPERTVPPQRQTQPLQTRESAAPVIMGSQDLMTFFDAVPAAHSGRRASGPGADSGDHHGEHERDNELGTILLECGILFHSLIIGVTLGVTPDDAFLSLLVAMFEGMALGVLIGNLNLSLQAKRLMCFVYPLTTPIGISLGIAIRNIYNENDGGVVLAQGIFNSLSAGILFYNTYTELMSAEVSHSGHFHGFSPYFKAACFVAMYSGAAAMAILAIWG
ncbi:UNVERIFIED_CONTAM: hypothetical protein HDU68_010939 [Siphonaria sp. JEL0065]|nr:hypothetical protein HDU68_010939 [Siphonaria sp. JEL0065]